MSVGNAALCKAIVTSWNAGELSDKFTELGGEAPVLEDQEAKAQKPFPYCVLDQMQGRVITRMSNGTASKLQIIDVPVRFRVFAKQVDGDSRDAKEIAAYLAEEIMKEFGGHPTVSPRRDIGFGSDSGACLITQYQTDYGVRMDDDIWQWVVDYNFRCDYPFMV